MMDLFILSLFQHEYKVRTSTLFHLLKGKRTTSVLSYGYFNNSLFAFQLLPDLQMSDFQQIIQVLIQKKYLIEASGFAQITQKGQSYLASHNLIQQVQSINNYRYGKNDYQMWHYFLFLIQVLSHLSYHESAYIPLEQSPIFQQQLKKFLKKHGKSQLVCAIKAELFEVLSLLPEDEADYLARQMSGFQQIGQLNVQLLPKGMTTFEQLLVEKNRLHHFFDLVMGHPTSLLKEFFLPLMNKNINQSMLVTRNFIQQGQSIQTIAKHRKVKISTVNDHLIEWAITLKDFPFHLFYSKDIEQIMKQELPPYQNWNYQELKEKYSSLDFLTFRLAQIQQIDKERRS